MWVVKMNGEFQALFAGETAAWAFRAECMRLFPERDVTVGYLPADSKLIDMVNSW